MTEESAQLGRELTKISERAGDRWVDRDCPATFQRENHVGGPRVRLAFPTGETLATITSLMDGMTEPFQVLYVLHTPRGEGAPGRYQSRAISRFYLLQFFERFGRYLAADARYDLWVRSAASGAMLVWDRHNEGFFYGDFAQISGELQRRGFAEGTLSPIGEHLHHYRSEFDDAASKIIAEFDWQMSPLRPEDIQFHP